MSTLSITCPECGMTSYNPNDVRSGYCGNCHDWTSKAEPPVACAVCGRMLDFHQAASAYEHTAYDQPADHPPVPVRAADLGEQLRGRCDFCQLGVPAWQMPVGSFAQGRAISIEDWAACEECRSDIDRNDWAAVLRRFMAQWRDNHPRDTWEEAERRARAAWRMVRKHRRGGFAPISWG